MPRRGTTKTAAKDGAVHNPHTNHGPKSRKEGTPTMDTGTTAVETVTAAFGETVVVPVASGPSKFASLVANAAVVDGATLERQKKNLEGIPFVVTSITARDGVRSARTNLITNYFSLEVVVADAATLSKMVTLGRITMAQAQAFMPEESVVINDGSTGIARQVVSFLHNSGYIVVPEGPESGPMESTRWDLYRGEWGLVKGFVEEPSGDIRFNLDPPLYSPRGLRVSTYDSDFNPDGGETFYFG